MKKSLVFIILALVIGIILVKVNTKNSVNNTTFESEQQNTIENNIEENESSVAKLDDIGESDMKTIPGDTNINDDYIKIDGGSFLMGSPKDENWRSDDEEQHKVEILPFYIDKYEVTQKEYETLTNNNPSEFKGSNLPVENVSWIDAVKFANIKSEKQGLTPCYLITEDSVSWDTGANGYRLPTEAEWEFACRAGTMTPFNLEKCIMS